MQPLLKQQTSFDSSGLVSHPENNNTNIHA